MSELISYQLDDGVATLTLANGKVNAISPAVIEAFNQALDRAEQAPLEQFRHSEDFPVSGLIRTAVLAA